MSLLECMQVDTSHTARADVTVGTVSVLVRGAWVSVPEPSWCVSDHRGDHISLDDVSHYSESISLAGPVYGGGTTEVLSVSIYQWPFDGDNGAPYLGLDADGSSDVAPLTAETTQAFLSRAAAHLERIRALAQTIGSAQ